MKLTINFSISEDDTGRYSDSDDLRSFYQGFGCSGMEVMPLMPDTGHLITPDMVTGVHACCITDWMDLDRDMLLAHYRKDLDYARNMRAEYVVFHITQVSYAESLTYQMVHSNEEVIDASAEFINQLLDGTDYDFYFLMENLWWPGLTFEDPATTQRLLDKKGTDAGHRTLHEYEYRSEDTGRCTCLSESDAGCPQRYPSYDQRDSSESVSKRCLCEGLPEAYAGSIQRSVRTGYAGLSAYFSH